MVEHPEQSLTVVFLQPHRHESLLRHLTIAFVQHIAAEHWCERKSHKCGSEQSRDESYAKRYEHPALHTAEEEQRGKADDNDKRGIENRHTHLT